MAEKTLLTLQWEWLSELLWIIDSLTGKGRHDLLVLLHGDMIERKKRALRMIIDDLKHNNVVEYPEEVECEWVKYKWRRVCLDLWWDKCECFISNDMIKRGIYENSILKKRWFYESDIVGLFNIVWEYMKKCLLNIDDSLSIKNYEYTRDGNSFPIFLEWWDVGRCIVEVLRLKNWYRYIINLDAPKSYRTLYCHDKNISWYNSGVWGCLLLK